MNKKKLLAIALVVVMIATLSFSTLAWFTDSEEVYNEFLIAGSDDENPDDIFSVDVWEDKDGDGQPDDDDQSADKEGLLYENILPGDKLAKDVHVENTGSYDQYIRVTVTVSDAQAWIAAMGSDFDVTSLFVNFDSTKWNHVSNNLSSNPSAEKIIYTMYYKEVLPIDDDITVFTHVQIPTSLNQQQAAAFAGGFTVDVKADAVQTANVVPEGTAAEDAAWAAFKTVKNGI